MVKLNVCGKFELPYVGLDGYTHMISIQDSGPQSMDLRPASISEERYLSLHFSDVTDPVDPDAPNRSELARLLSWLGRQHEVEALLVHCDAGMRRSPAVALFCVAHFESAAFEDAMAVVQQNSATSYIWPNELVVQILDELVAADGAAVRAVDRWKSGNIEPF